MRTQSSGIRLARPLAARSVSFTALDYAMSSRLLALLRSPRRLLGGFLAPAAAALLFGGGGAFVAQAQPRQPQVYDASWYDGDAPYVEIAVAADGVYRVTGEALGEAGVPLDEIAPATLRLLEKGREVPLRVQDEDGDGAFSESDRLAFVGRRNRGTSETWAYDYRPSRQSSADRSLYTDTLTYWLTWGGKEGRRYRASDGGGGGPLTRTVRDTLHRERDDRYHRGNSSSSGDPLFTRGEGYYWTTLRGVDTTMHDLSLPRATSGGDAEMRLSARLVGKNGGSACHRVALQADFGGGFETLAETQWKNYDLATVEARVSQDRLPASGALDVRLLSFKSGFDELSGCRDGGHNASLDYVEAGYTRRLAPAPDGQQHFSTASSGGGGAARTYQLVGYDGGTPIDVFSPAAGRFRSLDTDSDGRTRFDAAAEARSLWAAAGGSYRSPAGLAYQPAGSAPDWTDPAGGGADYVVLTSEFLSGSAEEMAAYRASEPGGGYSTAVVSLDEVYDQFDYGRATPIAIRRFIHHTQRAWDTPARFVTLWGDASSSIRTASPPSDAPWGVPTFGTASSDAWYAMQYDGADDWSEVVALGRVPVRTAEQGATFLEKLEGYESSPLRDWQKRYLALSGGSDNPQQRQLQRYNTEWAREAAAPPTGMDTIYFSKKSDASLDYSFQDSLNATFERGAGWLNYFGHSAAQNWEIVTAKPIEFDNAGRLPFVVSLGCKTGAFAGQAPSFGEQLVLGMNPDAPLGPGSQNGSIAHFGTSHEGFIRTSATINDSLISVVYRDTVRKMGAAVQQGKAALADQAAERPRLRAHLLQYNLLGEPAARLQVPDRPNLHLEASQIEAQPLAPVPSDSLRVAVTVEAQGLVPGRTAPGGAFRDGTQQVLADSTVALTLSQRLPNGDTRRRTDTLDAFAVDTTVHYRFFLEGRAVGENTLRAETDYVNHPLAERQEVRAADNTAEVRKNVFASGLRLIAPSDHGMLPPGDDPLFRISLSSDAPRKQPVRVELAADSAFNDVLAQETLQARGPLAKWRPSSVSLKAGRTYYWRARLGTREEIIWRRGTFTARPPALGSGWLQQGGQFSALQKQDLHRRDGRWAFRPFDIPLYVNSNRGHGDIPTGFRLGGGLKNRLYLALGIGVLILDGESARVKASATFCTADAKDKYIAPSNNTLGCGGDEGEAAIDRLQTFIETTLDEGDYLFTRTRPLALSGDLYPPQVQRVFRCLGTDPCGASGDAPVYSQAVDTLDTSDLWVMAARKGAPDQTVELTEPTGSGNSNLNYRTSVGPFVPEGGQATTARIGPARDWNTATWQASADDADDRLTLEVLAEDGETVLRTRELASAGGDASSDEIDLSGIDAREHPYLRLRATLADSAERTPPQLRQWHVGYTPTAELAVDRTRLSVLPSDTLSEGQAARVRVPIVNISGLASEPVRARVTLTDSSNQTRALVPDTTLGTLPPDSARTIQATLETAALVGENTLLARARQHWNAASAGDEEVPERLGFNNSAVRDFLVRGDRTAPELQVYVDGRTLPVARAESPTNPRGPEVPFVSLNPTFEIVLSDDSQYLTLDKKDLIEVRFGAANPLGQLPTVPFTDEALQFDAAEQGGKPAKAIFSPDLDASSVEDTTYTLKVEVQDTKGNEPETTYRAHVRIRTEVAVEDLYPYPSPMSTHTDFMFRLQGSDVSAVEACRMRIYTLSGQMLRDVDLMRRANEGAGLKPGWNRLRWEGRDADGDRLPTGVYLYKVHMEGEGDLDVNDGAVEKIAIIR